MINLAEEKFDTQKAFQKIAEIHLKFCLRASGVISLDFKSNIPNFGLLLDETIAVLILVYRTGL